MKRFILWLTKISGVYDQVYYAGWKDAGRQMSDHTIWWNQSKAKSRRIIQRAFYLYSESLKNGCRPNMIEVRKEIDIWDKNNPIL